MSASGGLGETSQLSGPPYAPHNTSLGGVPDKFPDIPITAVFLFLFAAFAIVHIKILKKNKERGHKFLFNGAMFAFCIIRLATTSLRIVWACNQRNIRVGIAAQTFVYVGTVILFIVNWFFTQRVVRAQHHRFGWSKPYRVFHRVTIVLLILCLGMLIVAAIQQFYTLSTKTLRIDRNMQLTGQTYFAAFCFAPVILITLSLILPRRRGTEKFGAGRLRNNIVILVIAVLILSAGQTFRCVTTWLPPVPLRNAQGQPNPSPWYFSKACFYTFNFATEILVVVFYAIVRVDLRFHIPDGSKRVGDYSRKRRESQYHVGVVGNEKNLKRSSTSRSMSSIRSNETLHEYEDSIFDDTRTLADSLRYPSTILEVDPSSGSWKLKRASQSVSRSSLNYTTRSRSSSLWDPTHDTLLNGLAPPLPPAPTHWPLRESVMPPGQVPVLEHRNRSASMPTGYLRKSTLPMPDTGMGDPVEEAIKALEANSAARQQQSPPRYDTMEPTLKKNRDSLAPKVNYRSTAEISRKHTYHPSPLQKSSRPGSELPKKHDYSAPRTSDPATSSDLPKKYTYAPPVETRDRGSRPPTPSRTRGNANADIEVERETANAEREFRRFSFEASPRDRSLSESERQYERSSRG